MFPSLRNSSEQDLRSQGRPSIPDSTIAFLILLVVALSLFLNLVNNDFPYWYHGDEKAKLKYIVNGGSNYRHPLLMIQINRLVNLFAGLSDRQQVAVMARSVSAVFGAALVFLTYLFSNEIVGPRKALLVALAAALSPILVTHAHYVKEDIVFAAFCTASVFFFLKFAEHRKTSHLPALGLCTGLAISSKYIGVLLIPVFFLAPLVCGLPQKRRILGQLLSVLALSCAAFALVNLPIFFDMPRFVEGFLIEARHASRSDRVVVSPLSHLFSFHLVNSVAPGVTWLIAVPCLLYIAFLAATWRRSDWKERFLLLYLCFFYFSAEISPMKVFPDFMRYVIPIIPVVCFFALRFFVLAGGFLSKSRGPLFSSAAFCLCLLLPAYDSANLAYRMNKDTRADLAKWLAQNPGKAVSEIYTVEHHDSSFLFDYRKKKIPAGTEYLLASSFAYGRFIFAGERKDQSEGTYQRYRFYNKLLQYSFVRFEPDFKSYGFSNPTLHVIRLSDLIRSGALESGDLELNIASENR